MAQLDVTTDRQKPVFEEALKMILNLLRKIAPVEAGISNLVSNV
jgi:hypothetical protein